MNSVKRIGYLFRKDTVEMYRPALLAYAAFSGVYLVVSLLVGIFGDATPASIVSPQGVEGHELMFGLILYIGGAIVTSRAFAEVHNRAKNHEWFMLPASTFEKFTDRLVLSSLVYSIFALVGYFLTTAVTSGISLVITRSHIGIFNPFEPQVWKLIANYWVVQSICLFGAAYFKKQHFVKTVLALIVSIITLGVFTLIVFRIVFIGYFDGVEPTAEFFRLFENLDNQAFWLGNFSRLERPVTVLAKIIRWVIIAPLFWTLTYLRLREAEVSHGV